MLLSTPMKINDFSGGLITKASELSLEPNQSPDCLNVHSDIFKSLQKRLGYAKLNSVSMTATSNGIYNFRRDSTTQYLIGYWGTNLKKMDVVTSAWDGTWDSIVNDANRGTALSDSMMYNSTYRTDCIFTTEARDIPQKYDSTDATGYTNIDWQTSHCYIVGDVTTVTMGASAYLKITIDSTVFDNVDVRSLTSIATVVSAINAHAGLSVKGFAYSDATGYLRIISNTRGSTGTVLVEDGSSDASEATEALFSGTSKIGTAITTNIAPNGKYNIIWRGMCWIANTAANPDRIYYSAPSDITAWDALDYETITTNDSDITGLATLRGRMYIFKKFSIHRVTYLGGTPMLEIAQAVSTAGTSSPRSICNVEIPGSGEVLMFLGSDMQIYMFDGYNATPISEAVSSYNSISSYCMVGDGLTYGINPDQLLKVHAVNDTNKHWYRLFFCLDNDTTTSDAFIYDYYSKSLWPNHYANPLVVSCLSDNGAGQRRVYVAGANYAWLMDIGNNDDSTAISAYWISGKIDFGSEIHAKKIRNVNISTGSVACTPYFQYRMDWESSYSTAEALTSSINEHTFDVPRFDELMQVKLYDNSTSAAFNILRLTFEIEASGVTR